MKKLIAILLLAVMAFSLCAFKLPEKSSDVVDCVEAYKEAERLFFVEKDYSSAFKLLKSVEEQNYAPAIELLGYCYCEGYGTKPDFDKALDLFCSLSISNLAEDYEPLVMYYAYNLDATSRRWEIYSGFFEEAQEQLDKGRDKGRILLCLGRCYEAGLGTAEDKGRAMSCYLEAAELGSSDAMNNFGAILYRDDSRNEDCLKWFKKSAELGNSAAMCSLGSWYRYSRGSAEEDIDESLKWFKKAAELGNSTAMWIYGDILLLRGADADKEEALDWIEKSIELGNPKAMTHPMNIILGGPEPDSEKVLELLNRALGLGCTYWMTSVGEKLWAMIDMGPEANLSRYLKAAELGEVGGISALLSKEKVGGEHIYSSHEYAAFFEDYYREAEAAKNGAAMYVLSNLHMNGVLDYGATEEELLLKAAEYGYFHAREILDSIYSYYDPERIGMSYEEVMEWHLSFMESGDNATDVLARICVAALETEDKGLSEQKVTELLMASAARGNVYIGSVMTELGKIYEKKQRMDEAYGWYLKSAELGNSEAMCGAAWLCDRVLAETMKSYTYVDSLEWYLRAAELGNREAMGCVSWFYKNGAGVDRDFDIALDWALKAAEHGYSEGMKAAGELYSIKMEYEQARSWYTKAVRLGNEFAEEQLEALSEMPRA